MDLGSGGGKKRALDAALNLVPFIDLMAVTIVFLIMTAVWTQLGRLQVGLPGHDMVERTTPQLPPVALVIGARDFTLLVGRLPAATFARVRDAQGRLAVDELARQLVSVKSQLPEQAAITLKVHDELVYDDLVRVIDACVGSEFPSVTVESTGEAG